jgi:Leucine-rich repeat (LRR) protein
LQQLSRLPQLKSLTINYCKAKILPAEITGLKNLEILDLSYNSFSTLPKGLKKLKKLRQITIDNNNLSEEEKIKIKNLLPKVNVIYK